MGDCSEGQIAHPLGTSRPGSSDSQSQHRLPCTSPWRAARVPNGDLDLPRAPEKRGPGRPWNRAADPHPSVGSAGRLARRGQLAREGDALPGLDQLVAQHGPAVALVHHLAPGLRESRRLPRVGRAGAPSRGRRPSAPSARPRCAPPASSRPSAPMVVDSTGVPTARASTIFSRVPAADPQRHDHQGGTLEVGAYVGHVLDHLDVPARLARAPRAVGLRPTISSFVSGSSAWMRGRTSRQKWRTPSTLGP